jgi:HrpA-like RNA helicase
VFDSDFSEHAQPEIRTRPVEDLVLQLKGMFIDNVSNFPFPTPPDSVQIHTAEKKLMLLGKIKQCTKKYAKQIRTHFLNGLFLLLTYFGIFSADNPNKFKLALKNYAFV